MEAEPSLSGMPSDAGMKSSVLGECENRHGFTETQCHEQTEKKQAVLRWELGTKYAPR